LSSPTLTNIWQRLTNRGKILSLFLVVFIGSTLSLTKAPTSGQIVFLDRYEKELYRLTENRQTAELYIHSKPIIASTLVAEDQRFFIHNGIDPLAIGRMTKELITEQQLSSGGSTISQQVARSILGLNRPRNMFNKAEDIFLATFIESAFSKEDILQHYLTYTDYGNSLLGVELASEHYFNNNSAEISWPQATLLAALVKNPSQLLTYRNLEQLQNRQKHIADNLLANKLISTEEHTLIYQDHTFVSTGGKTIKAPHFVYFVLSQLEQQLGQDFWHGHDVRIITTLDLSLYEHSRSITQQELEKLAKKNVNNSASIIINNDSGEVMSYIGNSNFFDAQHAGEVDIIQSLRQPGSALKPFIYLATVLNGWGTGTIIYDIPSRFLTASNTPYTPLNYDLQFHGPVTMRTALANSYNIPAVKALEFVGVAKAKSLLQSFGISSLTAPDDHYGLSLALGSGEVSLWELSNAYRTLAQQGQFSTLKTIQTVNIDGHITPYIPTAPQSVGQQALVSAISMITNILSDNSAREAAFETYNDLNFIFPVAAKTGTSRNFNDNWTLGFSSDYTVGVWVGNADGTPMQQVSGITGAGPIFNRLMNNLPGKRALATATNIQAVTICLPSGLLPSALCPHTTEELFLPNTGPTQIDNWYKADGLHLPTELSSWQAQFSETTKLATGLVILAPQNYDIFKRDAEIPLQDQAIPCRINSEQLVDVTLTLNGKNLENQPKCNLPLVPGKYILRLTGKDQAGKMYTQEVSYQVLN